MPAIASPPVELPPRRVQVNFRAPEHLRAGAAREAHQRGVSLSELIRTAVSREVQAS
jgi:predicted HicB family RNase H-like nuclease